MTNTDQSVVDVISAASDTVTSAIGVGQMPWQLAVSTSGSTIYVADGDSDAVSVFDTSNDSLVGSFNVGYGGAANSGDGEEPTGIVLTTTAAP